jgi:hypothetical protein
LSKNDNKELELRTDNATVRLEGKVDTGFSKVDAGFAKIQGEIMLLRWMGGLIIAGVASLILKAFF